MKKFWKKSLIYPLNVFLFIKISLIFNYLKTFNLGLNSLLEHSSNLINACRYNRIHYEQLTTLLSIYRYFIDISVF